MKDEDEIAMYYKKHVEPLLCKLAYVDGDASASSSDDYASYGSDENDKRLRIVKAYSPRKNGQLIPVRETRVARHVLGEKTMHWLNIFWTC